MVTAVTVTVLYIDRGISAEKVAGIVEDIVFSTEIIVVAVGVIVVYDARHVGIAARILAYGLQGRAGGLCHVLHLRCLHSHERQLAAGAVVILADDARVELVALREQVGHNLVVGSTVGRNFCWRASHIVAHVAQLVEILQAHHVAAWQEK